MRRTFREVVEKYNTEDAMRRGVVFIPVGWEHTIGGVGRPQALINKDLDECDGLVLVLHDRWGTNAGGGEGATGTEEEYRRAVTNLHDPSGPMEQLLVFFRSVETNRMSDPGPQLQQVLDFKKKLESERLLLYHVFETERDFEDKLRIFVADWVRSHERGERKGQQQRPSATLGTEERHAVPTSTPEATMRDAEPAEDAPGTKLEQASSLAQGGRLTEAEAIYADLAAPNNNYVALLAYADFLWDRRRKSQAEVVYRQALEAALSDGSKSAEGRARLKLGYFLSKSDHVTESEAELVLALDLALASGKARDLALARLRLGEVLSVRGDTAGSIGLYTAAFDDLGRSDDEGIRADLYAAMAQAKADLADYEGAADFYRKAVELKEKAGINSDLADVLVGLGSMAEKLDKPDEALRHYERSLALFEAEADLAGRADALDHLGHASASMGDDGAAQRYFDSAAGIFESIQKYDSAADIYSSLAKLYTKHGRKTEAEAAYRQALALVGRLKNRDEVAEIYDSLASLIADSATGAEKPTNSAGA